MDWLTFEVFKLEVWKYPILFMGTILFVMMIKSIYLILFVVMEDETIMPEEKKSKRDKSKNRKKEVIG